MKQDGHALDPIVLDDEGAAKYICVPPRAIGRLVAEGRLVSLRITKGRRIALQELDDFVRRELDEERRKKGL